MPIHENPFPAHLNPPDRFPSISPKCPHFLHGADYNPDQWPAEIWDEDMKLIQSARCNAMAIGIFAWARLEPKEGEFDFSWLDIIMDKLAAQGAFAILATPSGSRPAWLSQKYPEVLRVQADRTRKLHGRRHNHCYTSAVYRQKTALINRKLAQRYKDHPNLLLWHVSNEYGGECHCPLCQAAFRDWLRARYGNDLEKLNQAWWTAFWSHTYSDWSQIESPSPIGEGGVHGLTLDWKRFVTHQTIDFMLQEMAPLRELSPSIPVTTNFMGTYPGLNYFEMARHIDVVSWDSYPSWHGGQEDWRLAAGVGFHHDLNRCLKGGWGGRPFMLMESTPSNVNWQEFNTLKRPGMHLLSSLQAVAHGSDTVQYFQWRKSRGAAEKFHGAVVDHVGHGETRVFQDVRAVGELLERLDAVVGTGVKPEAAILYDWENRWAIDELEGLGKNNRKYLETCIDAYRPFWKRGVPMDIIDQTGDFSPYKLLIAPMLYMLRPGTAEKLERFVAAGGTLVTTYWTGVVDENDLCFLGGCPGAGLRKVLGIWDEETDTLPHKGRNAINMIGNTDLGLTGSYAVRDYCALIHAEGAQVLATYGEDFYAGRPALTVNSYGKGRAFYVASRNEERFHDDFFGRLISEMGLRRALEAELPTGVTVQLRTDGRRRFLFLLNFEAKPQTVSLAPSTPGGKRALKDFLTGEKTQGNLELAPYGWKILEEDAVP